MYPTMRIFAVRNSPLVDTVKFAVTVNVLTSWMMKKIAVGAATCVQVNYHNASCCMHERRPVHVWLNPTQIVCYFMVLRLYV
jgi:hypothetical protein